MPAVSRNDNLLALDDWRAGVMPGAERGVRQAVNENGHVAGGRRRWRSAHYLPAHRSYEDGNNYQTKPRAVQKVVLSWGNSGLGETRGYARQLRRNGGFNFSFYVSYFPSVGGDVHTAGGQAPVPS